MKTATTAQPSAEVRALSDSDLIDRLVASDQSVLRMIRSALLHARNAGEVLRVLKNDRIPRGDWLAWLKARGISYSTAANYMRVFDRWPEVEAKLQRDANFSLSDAVRLLATPRKQQGEALLQHALPECPLYAVSIAADWLNLLRTMPNDHRARSREAFLRVRDYINEIFEASGDQ